MVRVMDRTLGIADFQNSGPKSSVQYSAGLRLCISVAVIGNKRAIYNKES